jgi:hypothetical protein
MSKIYVDVIAEFTKDGLLNPKEIIWDDGRHYKIDYVLEKQRAASRKAGGVGMRYKCMILGQERYLFLREITCGL